MDFLPCGRGAKSHVLFVSRPYNPSDIASIQRRRRNARIRKGAIFSSSEIVVKVEGVGKWTNLMIMCHEKERWLMQKRNLEYHETKEKNRRKIYSISVIRRR